MGRNDYLSNGQIARVSKMGDGVFPKLYITFILAVA